MNRLRVLARDNPEWVDAVILILGFALGANLFIFFKTSGITEAYMETLFDSYRFHWATPTISGIVIGIGFAVLEFNVIPRWNIRSVAWLIPLRLTAFTLVILVSILLVQVIIGSVFQGHSLSSTWGLVRLFVTTDLFLSLYVYLMLLGLVLNFIRAVGNRFGPGLLVNYISGKYRQPMEENRLFLFIDLNDSTTLAEDMGHKQYSEMLNKLFSSLSRITADYDGEIYQYVGDEAVLTWLITPDFDFTEPLRLYRDFKRKIQKDKGHYQAKYEVVPGFKAALHGGEVIVTELGHRRKDLAFHGDVLNTASRLLGRASDLNKDLLISTFYRKKLDGDDTFSITLVEKMVLRGKQDESAIYEVEV